MENYDNLTLEWSSLLELTMLLLLLLLLLLLFTFSLFLSFLLFYYYNFVIIFFTIIILLFYGRKCGAALQSHVLTAILIFENNEMHFRLALFLPIYAYLV